MTSGSILLLDTIGELASIYSLAYVAFVGGSLAPRGGHNILEPAGFGIPIIVGPHTENFRDIVEKFADGGGVLVVRDQHELQSALLRLLADPVERKQLGERALEVLKANQGATERTLAELEKLLRPEDRLMPTPTPRTTVRLGNPVSALFSAVVAARNALYDRGRVEAAAASPPGYQRRQHFRRRRRQDSVRDSACRDFCGSAGARRCSVARLRTQDFRSVGCRCRRQSVAIRR